MSGVGGVAQKRVNPEMGKVDRVRQMNPGSTALQSASQRSTNVRAAPSLRSGAALDRCSRCVPWLRTLIARARGRIRALSLAAVPFRAPARERPVYPDAPERSDAMAARIASMRSAGTFLRPDRAQARRPPPPPHGRRALKRRESNGGKVYDDQGWFIEPTVIEVTARRRTSSQPIPVHGPRR